MSMKISATSRFLGLIGSPVAQSMSPSMHNLAFKELGLDYVYLAFDLKEDQVKEGLEAFKNLGALGGNVTMPLKSAIMDHLDEISEDGQLIGAVNTFKIHEGKSYGYNTDGQGFVKALDEKKVDFRGKKVVLVGGGGAARAVASQLAWEGAGELVILNRTLVRAQEICKRINEGLEGAQARALEFTNETLLEEIQDARVLVDATSLGMQASLDQAIIKSSDDLPQGLFVADLVYDPRETKLLSLAREAGCQHMNGLMMLLWQGAIAFEIWTGQTMPIEKVKKEIFGD